MLSTTGKGTFMCCRLQGMVLDLNPIEHVCRDLSNLTELDRICREDWEKLPKYRCAKLVASYPRRLEAVIAAKGASTKVLSKGSEY